MAPEVIMSKCDCERTGTDTKIEHTCDTTYDFKADIWSLGVMMYELLASNEQSAFPFNGNNK